MNVYSYAMLAYLMLLLVGCRSFQPVDVKLTNEALSFVLRTDAELVIVEEIGVSRLDCESDCDVWGIITPVQFPDKTEANAVLPALTFGQELPLTAIDVAPKRLIPGRYAVMLQAADVVSDGIKPGKFYAAKFELETNDVGKLRLKD